MGKESMNVLCETVSEDSGLQAKLRVKKQKKSEEENLINIASIT